MHVETFLDQHELTIKSVISRPRNVPLTGPPLATLEMRSDWKSDSILRSEDNVNFVVIYN